MAEGSLDRRSLERLREDIGVDTVDELIGMYLADAPKLVATMRTAEQGGDARELERAAHTLKSTSDAMGAKALAEACRDLEHDCHEGRLERAPEKIVAVARLYEAAQKELVEQRAHTRSR